MAIICIYKIISPSGKIYIGKTINFKNRVRQYKKMYCLTQTKLIRSFFKYGAENHLFIIEKECKIIELNNLEIYYIKKYDCVKSGLNCKGGGGGSGFSEETLIKFSEAKKGHLNPNYKKSTWNKGIKQWENKNHPFLGKKLSSEHIKKMKQNNPLIYAKGAENLRSVKINQYSKKMVLIKKWGSSQCIMRELNIDSSSIIKCCKGKLKTTKGFIFKYENSAKIKETT